MTVVKTQEQTDQRPWLPPLSPVASTTTPLEDAVRSSGIALFTVDPQGRITVCQGRALADLGLETDALVGRPSADLPFPRIAPAVQAALHGVASLRTYTVAGIPFECRCGPIRDADAQVVGATIVAVDVAQRRDAHRRVHKARARAIVRDFAGAVADHLRAAAPARPQRRPTPPLLDPVDRLHTLLQTIAGDNRPVMDTIDLVTLLTGMAGALRDAAPNRHCHLTVDSRPCLVRADGESLSQALLHLVSFVHRRIADGASIRLVQRVSQLPDECARRLDLRPGAYAEIAVCSTAAPERPLAETDLPLDIEVDLPLLAADAALGWHRGRLLVAADGAARVLLPALTNAHGNPLGVVPV